MQLLFSLLQLASAYDILCLMRVVAHAERQKKVCHSEHVNAVSWNILRSSGKQAFHWNQEHYQNTVSFPQQL